MDQTTLVGMLQTQGRLTDIVAGLLHGQWAIVLDQVSQIGGPLDIFHDQEMSAVDLIGVESAHNMGMRQGGNGPDFSLETLDGCWIFHPFFADQLQGDDAAKVLVTGLENLAHAPFAQALQENVRTKDQVTRSILQKLVCLIRRQPTPTY